METKIINGTAHAVAIRAEIKKRINACASAALPHLAVVLVGENADSLAYIRHKRNACAELGMRFTLHELEEAATQQQVLDILQALNHDKNVHGILVQQPLPAHINTHEIVCAIAPEKDVDCLHPLNLGLVAIGKPRFLPATPAGVIELLKREGIDIAGKNAVIVGRSDVVGKPLAFMLLAENATVTICHSKTQNLEETCRGADILIAAIRDPKYITVDYVKPGAVVIDVGINLVAARKEGKKAKLCGDVDYDGVLGIASHITPVPGGVGPMTIAALMQNCVRAWEDSNA